MKVERVKISKLVLDPANARKHSAKNLEAIKGSLQKFGQQKPIVIGKNNVVIAGNGTLEAARSLEWKEIDVVRTTLQGTEAIAFALADNRTGELAEWDSGVLSETLKALETEFDLSAIGFDDDDLAKMIKTEVPAGLTDPDAIPEKVDTRCKPGDLWILGNHRLLCGDSTNVQHVEKLMGGEKADMVFTDPPYGIEIVGGGKAFGKVGGGNIIPSNTYRVIEGDTSTAAAIAVIGLTSHIKNRIFWGANYYAHSLNQTSSWIIWNKEMTGNFGDGEMAWSSSGRPLQIFKHTWNGLIKESERRDKRVHPTQKPVALAEWCFSEYGREAKSVLDLFLGSGSTLIACEKTNRRCFGMEIDPHYCDVILKRWEDYTGKKASLVTADKQLIKKNNAKKTTRSV